MAAAFGSDPHRGRENSTTERFLNSIEDPVVQQATAELIQTIQSVEFTDPNTVEPIIHNTAANISFSQRSGNVEFPGNLQIPGSANAYQTLTESLFKYGNSRQPYILENKEAISSPVSEISYFSLNEKGIPDDTSMESRRFVTFDPAVKECCRVLDSLVASSDIKEAVITYRLITALESLKAKEYKQYQETDPDNMPGLYKFIEALSSQNLEGNLKSRINLAIEASRYLTATNKKNDFMNNTVASYLIGLSLPLMTVSKTYNGSTYTDMELLDTFESALNSYEFPEGAIPLGDFTHGSLQNLGITSEDLQTYVDKHFKSVLRQSEELAQ
jgi:hypothetical protein